MSKRPKDNKRRFFRLRVPKDVRLKGSLEPTVDQIRLGMNLGEADDRTSYAAPHESVTGKSAGAR